MSTTNRATVRSIRKQLQCNLASVIAPFLWESGFRSGPIGKSTPLKVWLPRDAKGQLSLRAHPLPGGFAADSFMGFTATGIITDVEGGGLSTVEFTALPVEDLIALDDWMAEARRTGTFGRQAA